MEDGKDERLSRSERGDTKSTTFRNLILDALELLEIGQPQDAAFKIDDAMLLLPPEKRIGRGGVAEWGREWWQGHLAPIRASGGMVTGEVPNWFADRNEGGSDIYLAMFGMGANIPEILIAEILKGNVLHPHLPDRDNPAWVLNGRMDDLERSDLAGSAKPNSLLFVIITMAQVAEYLNVASPHNPWLNAMMGLLHASMAHLPLRDPQYKGIKALMSEYRNWYSKNPGTSSHSHQRLEWLFDYSEEFFERQEGGLKGGAISESLWDLLTTPRDRREWARINDELAVKHISRALRFLPWAHGWPLGFALGVCLARLGRYDEAQRQMGILQLWTVRANEPTPLKYCFPMIRVNDKHYSWILGDQTPPASSEILKKRELTLGRSTNNDLALPDPHISREHAKVWMDEGVVWIQDLGSRNGTYLDDIRLDSLPVAVPARRDIESWVSESTIRLGRSELTLYWPVFYDWPDTNEARDIFYSQGFDSSCRYWETEIDHSNTPDHFGNRLRIGIRALALGELPSAVGMLDEEIASHINDDSPVPFELYHVRSKIQEALGNQELARQDGRSAQVSLAAEFAT
jgi:hypothetical protein